MQNTCGYFRSMWRRMLSAKCYLILEKTLWNSGFDSNTLIFFTSKFEIRAPFLKAFTGTPRKTKKLCI